MSEQTVSEFQGSVLGFIGYSLLFAIIGPLTLSLAVPWIWASFYSWKAQNTIIGGRRLTFDGTGSQLFGKYVLWTILTIITLGIYGFWLYNKLEQWKIKHTHFAD